MAESWRKSRRGNSLGLPKLNSNKVLEATLFVPILPVAPFIDSLLWFCGTQVINGERYARLLITRNFLPDSGGIWSKVEEKSSSGLMGLIFHDTTLETEAFLLFYIFAGLVSFF